MKKAYFNWSSGKDSALALYYLLKNKEYSVDLLLTNLSKEFERVSMHGLHENLLDQQAKNIGIELKKNYVPQSSTLELYNSSMKKLMYDLKNEKFTHAIFGDIFLEDLKHYREKKLAEVEIQGVFPLWKKESKELIKEFINLGFKAITVCVNDKLLGQEFVGRLIDEDFLNQLPSNVDVCGENGEFHTFVFDGPIFKEPVNFKIGEKVLKSYPTKSNAKSNFDSDFWFCDLIPL